MVKDVVLNEKVNSSEENERLKNQLSKIEEMLLDAERNGKQECFIYDKELWDFKTYAELFKMGFMVSKIKKDVNEPAYLRISWF